jgi:hypothetical protein
MTGTWLVNVILGFSAFLFTILFSIMNNTWMTSLLRGVIGFVFFFLLAYILRYVLNQKSIGPKPKPIKEDEFHIEDIERERVKGIEEEDTSFQALNLGALHNGVEVTRQWLSQNQEG